MLQTAKIFDIACQAVYYTQKSGAAISASTNFPLTAPGSVPPCPARVISRQKIIETHSAHIDPVYTYFHIFSYLPIDKVGKNIYTHINFTDRKLKERSPYHEKLQFCFCNDKYDDNYVHVDVLPVHVFKCSRIRLGLSFKSTSRYRLNDRQDSVTYQPGRQIESSGLFDFCKKGIKTMKHYFQELVRENFRFGRM